METASVSTAASARTAVSVIALNMEESKIAFGRFLRRNAFLNKESVQLI